MTNFSTNLKNIRKKVKITQSELGKRLDVSDRTISSWESGRTEPTMDMVEKISSILECRKSDLIGWNDDFLIESNFGTGKSNTALMYALHLNNNKLSDVDEEYLKKLSLIMKDESKRNNLKSFIDFLYIGDNHENR